MYTVTIILHLIACFLMIAAILLQAGKGAEIGASFGGSSQTIFGSRGPGTFLSKVTIATAVIFMTTSLSLALLSKQQHVASSVIEIPEASPDASESPEASESSDASETTDTSELPNASETTAVLGEAVSSDSDSADGTDTSDKTDEPQSTEPAPESSEPQAENAAP